jgi:hypothetical protein
MNIIHLLYLDNNLNNIKKMYEKIGYFDQYSGSVVLFIIITIIVIILITYFHTMINIQPIINDWPNQRCKPNIIPIAGLITHPAGMTASEYTTQNFNYCTQNILSSITGTALQPLSFVTNMLTSLVNVIQEAIQSIRAMFNKVRTLFQEISQEVMGRIMNIMIPLQQIIISFKDLIGKIQGSMAAALFTLLGTYYTLQSLMGAIAQFIVIILITLAALIAVFWLFPFTWGFAITNTAIFIAIAVPMAIILAFMVDVLNVNPNLSVPTLSVPSVKCFDKDTLIEMEDGSEKRIIDICIGDKLLNNNIVTSKFKVALDGSKMYILGNIIVSDSHIINYKDKWIPVCKHPDASLINQYYNDDGYLYCLNTTNKTIQINNFTFTDWDEIYDDKLYKVINNDNIKLNDKKFIHKYLDYGFSENTLIKLIDGTSLKISEVNINDILENGEKVYGIVEINGSDLFEQCRYNLGKNIFLHGYAPNLSLNKEKMYYNYKKLFNILTDKKTFKLYNIILPDYNNGIDRFLETNK